MTRPLSINLFAMLFGLSCALSLWLAIAAKGATGFGFAMTPEAAHTLAVRIFAIRLFGIAFAATLLLLVVVARSSGARAALVLRWVLGLATSVAFLRGVGLILPGGAIGAAAVALSMVQLTLEGLAIALLFGPDAAEWFDRGSVFGTN